MFKKKMFKKKMFKKKMFKKNSITGVFLRNVGNGPFQKNI